MNPSHQGTNFFDINTSLIPGKVMKLKYYIIIYIYIPLRVRLTRFHWSETDKGIYIEYRNFKKPFDGKRPYFHGMTR